MMAMSVFSRVSSRLLKSCGTHRVTLTRSFKPRHPMAEKESKLNITVGSKYTKRSTYILYTAAVVPVSFVGGVIWQYENIRKATLKRLKPAEQRQKKEGNTRDHLNVLWNAVSPGKKIVLSIISVNLVVFQMWKMPRFLPMLTRYFSCSPSKAHSVVSSTLSAFSHQSGFHLFVNMYVLWSFSDIIVKLIGKEQFVATYIGAATFSGTCSALLKISMNSVVPSVGASGAIMAMLAMFCQSIPEGKLQIALIGEIFPHSFSASTGLAAIVLIDTVGLLMRWKVLDHAGHLGGVFFGLGFIYLSKNGYIRKAKEKVLNTWHKLRK